ncbi:MAG: phosphoesterase [Desulfurococcales archaeon]|nr:phosphoesterase [Desulfurococcales archaeon]
MDGKVLVIGDWDADGVVSAAMIVYVQEKLGAYPFKGRVNVDIEPAGPRSIGEVLYQTSGCWEYVVIVDIPFTSEVESFLSEYRSRGCRGAIFYFDHHPSTIENATSIEEKYGVTVVTGRSATSVLLLRYLEGMGIKLSGRLRSYATAVAHLEGRRWREAGSVDEKLVSLVASISKTLNVLRDREVWRKYVKWMASPLPLEPPKIKIEGEKEELLRKGLELSKEADEEAKRAAMELAFSAVNLGYAKLVDARGKWRKRGASALASWLYKIIGQTIVLLVERHDGVPLVIIRSNGGVAKRTAEKLLARGLVEDVGGHGNLAISRLPRDFDLEKLKEHLRRALLEAYQESRGNIF